MSNTLKLQVLLKAVDQATRPFKAIQNASKSLSGEIRETQASIKALDAQAAKIDGFRKSSAQLAVTQRALQNAKAEAAALAVQFRNTARPTAQQAKALDTARRAAAELQAKTNSLRLSVQQQREALNAAGISTRNLNGAQQRLRSESAQATLALNQQRQSLQRLNQQQERLNRTSERYRQGQALSGSVRNAGAAGLGAATVGTMAGVTLLRPGYDFAQANSTLQAVLGLDKNSADFQSLRTQARSIGDNTAASANDAANAQIIIAKSGGSVDDIKAATPVTLNMSLANNRSMEESAQLLMSTKSAFGLANSEVAHLGDVISATLNKTAADFDGLNDALTYIAPVAKNAGVSVEQTTAMIGALAQEGTTGSMAGTAVRAMLLRVQAPTGEAFKSIKELGVKTADKKGDMRPFFTILKEMQQTFDRKHLGSAQRAEYLKTIFGEEAAAAAVTLMKGASTGLLDNLTHTFQKSDGSTAKLVTVQQDNLGGDFKEAQSAAEAIGTDLYDQQESGLRRLTQGTTEYLLKVDKWIQNNRTLAGGIANIAMAGVGLLGAIGAIGLLSWPVVAGVNALIAAGGILGTAFSIAGGAIASALGAISLPVIAVGAAIVGAGLLIRKYWEPIKAFIAGVAEGFTASMGPISEAFAPLKPLFSGLSDILGSLWTGFKKLIEPVKATQAELKSAGDLGKWLGDQIAGGLKSAIDVFDGLSDGIESLLQKLGIVKKESEDLDEKMPKPGDVTVGGAGAVSDSYSYAPALGGAPFYKPVTVAPGGGKTEQNTYTSSYVLNMHPGMTKDDALALIAQNSAREKRQAAAGQRSRMVSED
ncbi:phage tail tape measure protein [Chimaeribacter arupi]|uniref:Phage tail tape measure protein n=1 Tax=Chimaeribacter arupi TaxID=2060066 RepID=A0A2N5EJ34_9GAMM|nr:phage tail tape measure protein [Chimaeribacter arupi]PLR45414.1 phage tail tape measure protein [Chimaeribacter arupi]